MGKSHLLNEKKVFVLNQGLQLFCFKDSLLLILFQICFLIILFFQPVYLFLFLLSFVFLLEEFSVVPVLEIKAYIFKVSCKGRIIFKKSFIEVSFTYHKIHPFKYITQ